MAAFARYKLQASQRVDAIQITEPLQDIADLIGGEVYIDTTGSLNSGVSGLRVPTLSGVVNLPVGSWIIRDNKTNRITTLSADKFAVTYEPVVP
jgi:hypothetical protein